MAFTYTEGKSTMMSTRLYSIGQQLAALGCLASKYINPFYDANYADAVKKFQRAHNFRADGVLTDSLIDSISIVYRNLQNTSEGGNQDMMEADGGERTDTFFGGNKQTLLRQNQNDIRIVIGEQGQHVKTLKEVYLRSKSVVFDASGQPIAEQFEFIAKDLEESMESN